MFIGKCLERLSEMYEDFKCDDCRCLQDCPSSVICRSDDCLFFRANEYMYSDYAYEEDVYDEEDCYSWWCIEDNGDTCYELEYYLEEGRYDQ